MARTTPMTPFHSFINDSAPHVCDSVQHLLLNPSKAPSGRSLTSADNLFALPGMPVPPWIKLLVVAAPLSFLIYRYL